MNIYELIYFFIWTDLQYWRKWNLTEVFAWLSISERSIKTIIETTAMYLTMN